MTSLNRSITGIAWATALDSMRADRRPVVHILRGPNGEWDKRGIMRRAHQLAKRLGPTCRLSWQERLGTSLRTAWQESRLAGRPYSPSQVDRRWSKQRLVQSARTASSLGARS